MIRLADYVVQRLVAHGVRDIFLVTGGGAMHLNDAIAPRAAPALLLQSPRASQRHGCRRLRPRHRQARRPQRHRRAGGINALNGVFGAFTDSVPMLVISGQAKRETLFASYNLPHLRQLGDQEVDIVHAAGKMTKYAKLILDPATIRYELEKAIHLATSGRARTLLARHPRRRAVRPDRSR